MKKSIPNNRCKYYHETSYNGNWDVSYREFKPEDVMTYYDIYDNGSIFFYIKQKKRFLWWEWTKIWKLNTNDIDIREIPIMKQCSN